MTAGRILLDGAMGTALLARGLPAEAFPEEWVLGRPEEVGAVHAEHAAAGAELLLTCTFNLAAPRLERRLDAATRAEAAARAVALARGAAPGRRVAGALGPTGLAGADAGDLEARYAAAAAALVRAGADLLWLETQYALAEARDALRAARATGAPVVVTFTPREAAGTLRLPDGTPVEACLAAVAEDGAAAAGVNCVEPGPALAALAAWAQGRLPVPFVAKPAAGLPGAVRSPRAFAAAFRPALLAGVGLGGGCCGATGDHLRALAEAWSAA